MTSKAMGKNKQNILESTGRIAIDMLFCIKRDSKLDINTLDFVSEYFLGLGKVGLSYEEMHRIIRSKNPKEAWDVVAYSSADSDLPLFLMHTLKVLVGLLPMASVTQTLPTVCSTRGQQVRVFNQLLVKCTANGQVLDQPYVPKKWGEDDDDEDDEEAYQGATVLEMEKGYYHKPIATLDFNSLYPSIMMSNNLCYSTQVTDPKLMNLPGVQYHTVKLDEDGTTTTWVHQRHYSGVVPQFLTNLIRSRKAVKKDMEKWGKSTQEYANLDRRQNALKVSANSTYGYTGVDPKKGYMSRKSIARSVTATGRRLIYGAKRVVDEEFQPQHTPPGEPTYPPCRVIYGDTDSIMVLFWNWVITGADDPEIARIWAHMRKIASRINLRLREGPESALNIDTEKLSLISIFAKKKSYVMKKQDGEGKPFEVKMSGMEAVRRDYPYCVRKCQKAMIEALTADGFTEDEAVRRMELVLCQHLFAISENRLPVDDYTMTKELRDGYAQEQVHSAVVEKQKARAPGSEVEVGQRVRFVAIEGNEASKRCERTDDPEYVKAHPQECRIDRLYYFEKIANALSAMLTHVSPDAEQTLFQPYRSALERKRQRTATLASLMGEKDESIAPEAVLERAAKTRRLMQEHGQKRKAAEEEQEGEPGLSAPEPKRAAPQAPAAIKAVKKGVPDTDRRQGRLF